MLLQQDSLENDVEDVPFLPKSPSFDQSSVTSSQNPDGINSARRKIRMRLTIALFAIVLAFETGGSMLAAPMTRMFESITCLQYYKEHDPAIIGKNGNIPEELCKNKEIQGEVAIVKGYGELFDAMAGVLLSVPYGLLADKYGRKPIFCICIPGFVLNMMVTGVILYASDTFPLRMVWLSTLAWMFGGGFAVASTMVWTMMADVTAESQRAALFFKFGVSIMLADFISSLFTSWLMKYSPWIPMVIGWSFTMIGILPAVLLPETKGTFTSEKELAHELSEPSSPINDGPIYFSPEQRNAGMLSFAKKPRPASQLRRMGSQFSFIIQDKHLIFLLSTFLVYRLSRGTSWLLIQYISKRYHWTLANANFLNSFKSILTVFLFLALLPLASWYLTSRRGTHYRQKDLTLAKGSVILLLVGTFIMGISPSISLFIVGLIVQTLGIGFVFIVRSLATTMVHRDQTARLYTAIEILQSIGVTIASPTVTFFFNRGLDMGEGWIGLPWVVASGLFGATAVLLWMYRLPSLPKQSVSEASIAL
ncbi:MFS transporter [Blastomyces gilchristii SLH14081]|uniref:MFS transporter n=2 Tax=Blastomyces TaxID=229219 RepID=A0A179UN41_BLAGS|nr:MFS transporter [Blastomyces gilchristii SLH14081]EGE80445.1 MFS transporter [Blastomyces dermatitidis ATCC 18188]OAT08638.1 MFS transporter [Blastomyces gilchristii SLH14081]